MNFKNSLSENTQKEQKHFPITFGFASAVLLSLSSCSKEREQPVKTPTVQTQPVLLHDSFCADIKRDHFDAGVRQKIQALKQEVPEILQLTSSIEESKTNTLHFFDTEGFIKVLGEHGLTREQGEKYIINAGAMTFIPDKKTPTDKEQIYIYLSSHALANKENFIQGIVNELLNALMAVELPDELESKQRLPDISGGLNISTKEMRGIGIEFTKEYISGLVSTLILEKYHKNSVSCSLKQLKENLRKGIFWHTDTPNYAFEYFYDILHDHGFPVEKNPELLKLYAFCIDTNWPDISRNTQKICQWLNIPVKE